MRLTNQMLPLIINNTSMIKYLVIGSNNFWYSATTTKKEALDVVKEIQSEEEYNKTLFGDPESFYIPEQPSTVYVYRVKEIMRKPTDKN